MGTSALEFAKFGIPTILLDFSNVSMPNDYVYRWIYLNPVGNLGFNLDDKREDKRYGIPLEKILIQHKLDNQKISEHCFNYVSEFYSIKLIANLFLLSLSNTKLSPKMLINFSYVIRACKAFLGKIYRRKKLFEI